MNRALGGDILQFEMEDVLDREVAAWHDSESNESLAGWLGMRDLEYAFFVERPSDISTLLKARRYGIDLESLSSARDSMDFALAARTPEELSVAQVATLLAWLRETGRHSNLG